MKCLLHVPPRRSASLSLKRERAHGLNASDELAEAGNGADDLADGILADLLARIAR